jgi:ketosteroid isomerase-like protein
MFPGKDKYQPQLDAGRSYLAQKEFSKTVDILQQIPSSSPLYQQAQDLVAAARTADKKKNIDDLLEQAAALHKQNQDDDSLVAIRKVLDLDPTNQTALSTRDETQKALYDRKSQAEQDRYVEETRSAAQTLFAAGNLEAARAKIEEVLVVRANDSTAAKLRQRILAQLDAVARVNAERSRLEEARAGAEKARAAETDRTLQLQRSQAESARTEFEQSRVKARGADAETKSGARFQAALAQSVDAQNKFDRGDFAGARSQFDAASKGMLEATDEAANVTQATQLSGQRASMDTARQEMENTKRGFAGTDAQASAEEARARQLAQDGKLVDATVSYQRAASLWRDAVQKDVQRRDAAQGLEADRQSIRRSLDQYKTAYQAKDMPGIRAVFPAIPNMEESSTRNNFDIARSIQMSLDLGVNEIQISGETARVTAQQRFEIRSKENQTVRSEARIVFSLRKSNGSWLIQSITR